MKANSSDELDLTIKSASSEAQNLLAKIFKNLKEAAAVKTDAQPREGDKFFPNGIELIYVKVEAGLSEKIKVSAELKVAGEKGVASGGFSAEDGVRPSGRAEVSSRNEGT